jgi:uncharacterized protein (DUF2164 family)
MPEIHRGLGGLTEEARDRCIKEVISYFHDERNEEIGVIAAGNVLDFFLQSVGPDIYNKAIDDAKKSFQKQLEGLDFEIDLLKRQK